MTVRLLNDQPLEPDERRRCSTCSMTDLPVRNLVQHACAGPTLFTPNGTLFELYSFFIGYESGFKLMATMADYKGGHHYYDSVKSTLDWIRSRSDPDSPDGGISSFIAKCGSEKAAIEAINEFASKLATSVE